MSYRLGIDIGGTFTDIVIYDPGTGRHHIWKEPTTPGDPDSSGTKAPTPTPSGTTSTTADDDDPCSSSSGCVPDLGADACYALARIRDADAITAMGQLLATARGERLELLEYLLTDAFVEQERALGRSID